MQVDPALPWNGSVEGGTIQLREPLTLQKLLGGALCVVFKDGHAELTEGSFQIYPSDQKLYVGGNSLDYLITNVVTSSPSIEYSELILQRTAGADETLHSVSVQVPGVSASPSLPWSGTSGGYIILPEAVTFEQLKNGYLNFYLEKVVDSSIFKATQSNSASQISIKIDDSPSSTPVYVINAFEGTSDTIELRWNYGGYADYLLYSVSLA